MRERTLLIGALTATAIAAGLGVYKVRASERTPSLEIAPVNRLDSARLLLARSEGPPVRLTTSDGAGLHLAAMKVSAAIEDPIALTELHLTFANPEPRLLEGHFQITLPQGASVSRFAVKRADGTWQESSVVDRQQAHASFEAMANRSLAPALLEHSAGNEFSARVNAIEPHGLKEIIITYAQVLEAGTSYIVPLKGLPAIAALDIDVRATGRNDTTRVFGLHEHQQATNSTAAGAGAFAPSRDFLVEARQLPRSDGLRSGNLAIARVVPFATSRPDPIASAVVLIDTSASRALGLALQANLVRKVFAKLAPDTHISVACFDQEVVPLYDGTVSGFGDEQVASILKRGALGASDLQRAVAWAGDAAKKQGAKRIVFVSDGVATAGETDYQKIKLEVEKLRASKVERIDAIAVGGVRDDAFFRSLVRGVLDKDGVVLDADLGADALARRLGEKTSSGVPITVPGAKWSWPRTLDGVQAGDEIIVHAEIADGLPLEVNVGGQPFSPELRGVARPLIERVWAQAKIESMIAAPTLDPASTRREISALSTKYHVLSNQTAMLAPGLPRLEFDHEGGDNDGDLLGVQDGRVVVATPKQENEKAEKDEQKKSGGFDIPFFSKKKNKPQQAPASEATTTPMPAPVVPAPPPPVIVATPTATPAASASGGGAKQWRGPAPVPTPTPAPPKLANKKTPNTEEDDETRKALEALQQAQLEESPSPPSTSTPSTPVTKPSPSPRFAPAPPSHHAQKPTLEPPEPPPPPLKPSVRIAELTVEHGFTQSEPQRAVRAALPRLRACYKLAIESEEALATTTPSLRARVIVNTSGGVERIEPIAAAGGPGGAGSMTSDRCSLAVINSVHFPSPANSEGAFVIELAFTTETNPNIATLNPQDPHGAEITTSAPQYQGRFKTVMDLLAAAPAPRRDEALAEATRWRAEEPTNLMALIALGEASEAKGDIRTAARAYGSILELAPSNAESRRAAGERLERLRDPGALNLAIDTYSKALAQHPDHPAAHRLYAYALVKRGEYSHAFDVLRAATTKAKDGDAISTARFIPAERIFRDDLGLVAAAWAHAEPRRAAEIHDLLRRAGGQDESEPSLRFVIVWETSNTEIALQVVDGAGAAAKKSASPESYGNVTGYGPECVVMRGSRRAASSLPLSVRAQYLGRAENTSAMGYGMGKLQVIEHDGKGNLIFDERPFVVMTEGATAIDLGQVGGAGNPIRGSGSGLPDAIAAARGDALRQASR